MTPKNYGIDGEQNDDDGNDDDDADEALEIGWMEEIRCAMRSRSITTFLQYDAKAIT